MASFREGSKYEAEEKNRQYVLRNVIDEEGKGGGGSKVSASTHSISCLFFSLRE